MPVRTFHPWVWPALCALALSGSSGCGADVPRSNDDAGAPDSGGPDSGNVLDGGPTDAGPDAGAPVSVTFRYHPDWGGVRSVVVIGGFDAGNDWSLTSPFVTLSNDDAGTWTGAATLNAGQYAYLLVAVGDDAGGPALRHELVDPTQSAFVACPPASPSFSTQVANPCSVLTVPQPAPDPLFHVRGTATYDGGAAQGYLALLEREEPGSHHFMVNRVDVQPDGTFDLQVAPGSYRVQVLHPTFERLTDAQRNPPALNAYRRTLSNAFKVSSVDVALDATELSFYGYVQYLPTDGGASLPATFEFPVAPNATSAHAALYGGNDGGLQTVGDPWWNGAPRTTGPAQDVFDGGWNTTKATEPFARLGERYWWGTWQIFPSPDGGVQWTAESMVFPVDFHP